LEIWALPAAGFGEFVAAIPPPLSIGTVRLADGRGVKGFIVEPTAITGARDISTFGGWRAFMAESGGGLEVYSVIARSEATKQSIVAAKLDCFAPIAMTGSTPSPRLLRGRDERSSLLEGWGEGLFAPQILKMT